MLHWALRMARLQRTGKLVVAALTPLIQDSQQRLHVIPAIAWLDPYMLGFMAMLITALARAQQRSLSEADLCFIQAQAWSDLTGMSADLFGREALLLAESSDQEFLRGCNDAEIVAPLLLRRSLVQQLSAQDDDADAYASAWETTFDLRMASLSAAAPPIAP